MREAGAPPGRVLGRHGGQDLRGVGVGHRPEHALSDCWIGGANYVCGDAGSPSG